MFATFISTLALYIGTLEAARFTHNYLLTKVLHAPMSFFDQTPIGRIINRFSKDIEAVDSDLPATLRAFSACFFGVYFVIDKTCYSTEWCWVLALRRWWATSVSAFDVWMIPSIFYPHSKNCYYISCLKKMMNILGFHPKRDSGLPSIITNANWRDSSNFN